MENYFFKENIKYSINKVVFLFTVIIFYSAIINFSYCIGNDFRFMIDTIGIPEYNVLGERINEDIYNVYNVFVYSSPIEVMKKTNLQRFKCVEQKGKWKESGTNLVGEYYILGTSYSGDLVTNVYFPVDFIAETTPDKWNFLYNENALKSWSNVNKYKRVEQLEYMKNTNLQFDRIDYENNICDSYDLIEYDINANKIGLDKALLESCATWKTPGVISVNRLTRDNKVRYATFIVKPMSASAGIKSDLSIENDIILNDDDNYINIQFGASAINLNGYAKEEHIKQIISELYVDNEKVGIVSNSATSNVSKEITYNILKNSFESNTKVLNIKVKSYLYTEFSADGIMKDEIEKNITIRKNMFNKDENVPANNILVKKLEKINGDFFVSDLMKTKCTDNAFSQGIIEKGRYLAIKILDINTNEINLDNTSIKINDKELKKEFIKVSNNSIVVKVKIEEKENELNTIATWKYLKEKKENYFNVVFYDIGKRIASPDIIKIKFNSDEKIYKIVLDVIDEYVYNINYTFLDEIINKKEYCEKIRLDEWVK